MLPPVQFILNFHAIYIDLFIKPIGIFRYIKLMMFSNQRLPSLVSQKLGKVLVRALGTSLVVKSIVFTYTVF